MAPNNHLWNHTLNSKTTRVCKKLHSMSFRDKERNMAYIYDQRLRGVETESDQMMKEEGLG